VGILDEDVERVRAASNLVDVAGQYVALRRVGRQWVGVCPFHAEKTPSFSVNGEEGVYYCFGCQARGDTITFVREIEHLDFVGAVELLAAKSGITLRYTDRAQGEGRKRRARLVEALATAVDWYHERLLASPDAAPARSYLRSRGFDGDLVRRYRLGWAPEGWDTLVRALRLSEDVVRDTGLGVPGRRGGMIDGFRARVMFPIFDPQGDPVGFGGRSLPGGPPPKYRNSPETPLYAKSKVLYGLNWAKTDVVAADEVVVCEGYTDVIGFATAGVPRAVATCGTALTEDHVRLLTRFAKRVVLAFDADAAGQSAAERFYEWERRYGIQVAVAALPPGADPADLALSDPPALRKAVEQATSFLGFRVDRALDRPAAELRSPEGRAAAAEAALAMIREHPNEIVREEYAARVAARLGLAPQRLAQLANRRGGPVRVDRPAPDRRAGRESGPEVELVRLALHRGDELAELVDLTAPGRAEVLVTDDGLLAALRARQAAPSLRAAIDAADPATAEVLLRLGVEESTADPADVLRLLVRAAADRELAAWARLLEDADLDLQRQVLAACDYLKGQVDALFADHAESGLGDVGQLVAWLADRSEEGG
jgi:DNA primase